MNNNIYSNQELLKHKLFLEQLFLLDIEPKETLDRNLESAPEPLPQHLDKQHSVAAFQTKAKTSINPISVYALVVTLLLLLPSNRDRADGKTVAVSQEQKQIELLSAKLQQLESQTEILAVEIASNQKQPNPAVEYSTLPPSVVETDPATTVQAEAPLELAPTVSYNQPNSLKLPEYQLAAIPIPTPPPPTLWQSDSADGANVIPPPLKSQPLLLPVAALPSFSDSLQPGLGTISNSAQLPAPPLLIATGAEASIAPTTQQVQQPLQQWLGQTDMVYYSHSYGRQDVATVEQSSIDESVSTAQQQDERDLTQYLTSTQRAETQLEQNSLDPNLLEDSTSIAESLPYENDPSIEEEVVPTLEREPNPQQSLMVDSEDLDLALYLDSIPLLEEQSQAETESSNTMVETPVPQPSLFSDEDLAGYLSSTPLLDEKTIQQALGTSPSTETVQHQADSTATVNPVETVAIKTSEATQQLDPESRIQPSSVTIAVDESQEKLALFADEDLKQFLTSTPLFSDEILKQKLR